MGHLATVYRNLYFLKLQNVVVFSPPSVVPLTSCNVEKLWGQRGSLFSAMRDIESCPSPACCTIKHLTVILTICFFTAALKPHMFLSEHIFISLVQVLLTALAQHLQKGRIFMKPVEHGFLNVHHVFQTCHKMLSKQNPAALCNSGCLERVGWIFSTRDY